MGLARGQGVLVAGCRSSVRRTRSPGSAHRRLEDLAAFGSENLVEGVDELAGAVAHECLGAGELVVVLEQQVPRRLGGPDAGGVVGDTRSGSCGCRELIRGR